MARMQSGAEFSQFDQMTSKEGKERIMEIERGYGVIINTYLPREDFEKYKEETAEATKLASIKVEGRFAFIDNTIHEMNGNYINLLSLCYMFFSSKLFRFLNFFGRWFIYAEDGKIYPNTVQWKHMRPMSWMQRILFRLHIRKILTKIQEGSEEESREHPKPDEDADDTSETTVSDSTNL